MKYYLEAQHMPKGSARPLDQGVTLDIHADDTGYIAIPQVGDYVHIGMGMGDTAGRAEFSGKVASRLFTYLGDSCGINIVVADTDDDWGKLIKE